MRVDLILTSLNGEPRSEMIPIGQMDINDKNPFSGYVALWTMFSEPEFQDVGMLINGVQFHPLMLGALISQACAKLRKVKVKRNDKND
jgi:hypothetical protein